MLVAEIETTPMLTAIRLTAAHIRESSIDFFGASRMIAHGRNIVADIPTPMHVVSEGPSHTRDRRGRNHRDPRD